MLKAYSRVLEHLMLVGDLIIVVGCWLLAYLARFYFFGPARASADVPPLAPYLIMILPIVVVWGISFQAFDLYRPRRIGSRLSEVADVAKASSMAALVLVTIMTFLFREYDYSRVVIVYFWLFSIAAVSFARNVFREGMRFARRRGYNLRYGLVVGSGELAQNVIERLRGRPDIGIQVVGVVGDAKEGAGGAPWLGAYADLSAVLAARPVDHVVIALVHEDASRLPGLLEAIGDEPVTIHVVPDLFRFTSLRGGVEEFEGIPFVHLRESPLHGWNAVAKRVFDVVFSAAALVALSPVLALLAAAVRLTSRGPVLYHQDRMGLDGQSFRMLKFRTMTVDAEDASGPVWAQAGDPRRTPIGTFLRRFSLDELPQFVNVLRGEMSVVGPRPERPVFVERFRQTVPGYMLRHKVRSGLTGWAQIHGLRGNTSLEKRIAFDIEYIERWSFWLDLRIIAATVTRVLFDRNAY
jgi:Undecaprenyl-phosphate glucose phosphotransferase